VIFEVRIQAPVFGRGSALPFLTANEPRRRVQGEETIMTRWRNGAAVLAALALGLVSPAFAGTGQPSPWELGMQTPVTESAIFLSNMHDGVNIVIALITLFVLALLLIVIYRFNDKTNPVPSKTTHHTGLEIAWTLIPALILVGISIPSFRLLKMQVELPQADITIKAVGHQWYWSYEYPQDQGGGFGYDSYMLSPEDAKKANQPNLLAVDNELVLPAGKTIVVEVIGQDVIHNFAVPSFGIRMDAVPGRLNQTWFKTDVEGTYYGQCSRLCGANHAFMPISVRIVSPEKYAAWLVDAKKKFADLDASPVQLAAQ
jgi:cytochrome c oxidase subunit 2